MSEICSCLTCACYHQRPYIEQNDNYWTTPDGIIRRIEFLAQDFTYKTVNNAIRIVGTTPKVKWLAWLTVGDDRVCIICTKASEGGRNGFYQPNWFLPQMPAHPGCRCQWVVYYLEPE